MYLVRKASDDYYYNFTNESNIENLYKKYGSIVVGRNYWHQEEPSSICEFWENLKIEDAKKVSECKFEILIYDSYLD